MARGFGGETTKQEARGNEGLSVVDVETGRGYAATSAAIGGRDVDPGSGDGDNYTANNYFPNMARVNEVLDYRQKQEAFNLANGITDANPFGRLSRGVMGFAINKLGLNPKHVSYPSLSLSQRRAIANNQFSKFMNPQNKPGEIVNNRASDLFTGYNPNFETAKEGELRSGVQYDGYKTQYGDVMSQARKQGTGEMLARGAMGLAGGPIGMALAQIGTKEYGLPGQPGFERFDPNNPNPGGGILGQFLGGLNPTQAKDALVGAFAPVAPAPKPTPIGTAPADLKGFENRFGPTDPTTAVVNQEPRTFVSREEVTGNFTDLSPEQQRAANDAGVAARTAALNSGAGVREANIAQRRARTNAAIDSLRNIQTFSDPDEYLGPIDFGAPRGSIRPEDLSSLNATTAGEQLAGLFGEDPRTAGFRDLEGMIKSVVDGENFPDDQNMYGPGMPNQTPLTPDELNNLLEPYGMKLGRGPSSGGIMQLAV